MNGPARLEALTLRQADRFWDAVTGSELDVDVDGTRVALTHSDGAVIVETPATGDIGRDLRSLLSLLSARQAFPQVGGEA